MALDRYHENIIQAILYFDVDVAEKLQETKNLSIENLQKIVGEIIDVLNGKDLLDYKNFSTFFNNPASINNLDAVKTIDGVTNGDVRKYMIGYIDKTIKEAWKMIFGEYPKDDQEIVNKLKWNKKEILEKLGKDETVLIEKSDLGKILDSDECKMIIKEGLLTKEQIKSLDVDKLQILATREGLNLLRSTRLLSSRFDSTIIKNLRDDSNMMKNKDNDTKLQEQYEHLQKLRQDLTLKNLKEFMTPQQIRVMTKHGDVEFSDLEVIQPYKLEALELGLTRDNLKNKKFHYLTTKVCLQISSSRNMSFQEAYGMIKDLDIDKARALAMYSDLSVEDAVQLDLWQIAGVREFKLNIDQVKSKNFGQHTILGLIKAIREKMPETADKITEVSQSAFETLKELDVNQAKGVTEYELSRQQVLDEGFNRDTLKGIDDLRENNNNLPINEAYEQVRGLYFQQIKLMIKYNLPREEVESFEYGFYHINAIDNLHQNMNVPVPQAIEMVKGLTDRYQIEAVGIGIPREWVENENIDKNLPILKEGTRNADIETRRNFVIEAMMVGLDPELIYKIPHKQAKGDTIRAIRNLRKIDKSLTPEEAFIKLEGLTCREDMETLVHDEAFKKVLKLQAEGRYENYEGDDKYLLSESLDKQRMVQVRKFEDGLNPTGNYAIAETIGNTFNNFNNSTKFQKHKEFTKEFNFGQLSSLALENPNAVTYQPKEIKNSEFLDYQTLLIAKKIAKNTQASLESALETIVGLDHHQMKLIEEGVSRSDAEATNIHQYIGLRMGLTAQQVNVENFGSHTLEAMQKLRMEDGKLTMVDSYEQVKGLGKEQVAEMMKPKEPLVAEKNIADLITQLNAKTKGIVGRDSIEKKWELDPITERSNRIILGPLNSFLVRKKNTENLIENIGLEFVVKNSERKTKINSVSPEQDPVIITKDSLGSGDKYIRMVIPKEILDDKIKFNKFIKAIGKTLGEKEETPSTTPSISNQPAAQLVNNHNQQQGRT